MEQYQTNTQSREMVIQAATELEAQQTIETLNSSEIAGMDGIRAGLLRHGRDPSGTPQAWRGRSNK